MPYRCYICDQSFSPPLRTVELQTRQIIDFADYGDDDIRLTIATNTRTELRHYCSADCRLHDLPSLKAALGLRFSSPHTEPIMACGRCGRPVDGSRAHKSFLAADLISTEHHWTLLPFKESQFAVLCADCDTDDEIDRLRSCA